MMNISLKLSLLIFILVITSDIGSEARELIGANNEFEVPAESSNYAGTTRTLMQDPLQGQTCKADADCLKCSTGFATFF
ncbi:hypothetical protein CARUB_v10015945mg [Capsella rubella]|uniref:Uncharacterized protein n=1 Tax=Capsella rubella TaxID=81985 RepID=R0I824_9BRAS|nr:hypothetical protein CARUB_v10015945mg [Capsella rubella]